MDASAVYGYAADHYTRPALSFWDRYGAATVARLDLRPGDRVVDLCCGAGASAMPAAHAVGPGGLVIAVDAAPAMVSLARARATREGLANVDCRVADATATGLPSGSFDAVVCVFGIFFVPDMPGFVAEMWRLVAPGGTLAVTTWGEGVFEPGNTIFWDAVKRIEPALYKGFNPWDRVGTEAALRGLLPDATIEVEPDTHELAGPEAFWDIVLGSGYRGTVEALPEDAVARLRRAVLDAAVTRINTDVLYGRIRRPA